VEESFKPQAASHKPAPTVMRGVLVLEGLGTRSELSDNSVMSHAVLLDISGREVMGLKPGANDVRTLAPGVYFVRGPEIDDGRPGPAVTRVVVVK
jgi:hypothetical protein